MSWNVSDYVASQQKWYSNIHLSISSLLYEVVISRTNSVLKVKQIKGLKMENSEQSQLPKMKIFQKTKKHFPTLGINPNLAMQPYPINIKILMGFMIMSAVLICNLMYVTNDAETFAEYILPIYNISFAVMIIFLLIVQIVKVENLFELMDSCESLVNTSKCIAKKNQKPIAVKEKI